MYSTCIHCHRSLGHNESLERFPVGSRLAFDGAKGRLWVVCTSCGRWNLSPLEERWEAIEDCERRFRATQLRTSTGEIGLARISPDLDLVRIGRPLLPEMAAWRYGEELAKRHRRALPARVVKRVLSDSMYSPDDVERTIVVGAFHGLVLGTAAVFSPWAALAGLGGAFAWRELRARSRLAWLPREAAPPLFVRRRDAAGIRLAPHSTDQWSLFVPQASGVVELTGHDAMRALAPLLAGANRSGAPESDVQWAVAKLVHFGGALGFVEFLAKAAAESELLVGYRSHQLLALEMAVHEEAERRALEGELAEVEREWRAAEEIAAIADSLFLPEGIERRIEEMRISRTAGRHRDRPT